jgi:YesN/AraC family two-component response regulator
VALEGLLAHLGIKTVDKALNGRDALEMVKKDPFLYKMVITDNQMPHMIGIEFAKHIRTL